MSDTYGLWNWIRVGEREGKMSILRTGRTLKRLDEMLTDAIEGRFEEGKYDETELSRLESRWKEYLTTSKLSVEAARRERTDIKSILSDISHQTKTPLSNIILYSELLKEQPLTPEGLEIADQLGGQAKKLEFLIQALVKMSRLESDILEVKPKKQPLAPLVERAVRDVSSKAKKKSITIKQEPFGEIQAVYDLKWTREALFNILDNGVKYSPPGSAITISVKTYEMHVCIQVEDEGPGIPEEERTKIFQRFYRREVNQQEEGVGIGLYLAREILRKEDGYIKTGSGHGKGTVFGIYLGIDEFFQNC